MSSQQDECRRKTRRFRFPDGETWCVDFIYPEPGGFDCNMQLRDLSSSGASFRLGHELLGLEFGRTIKYATQSRSTSTAELQPVTVICCIGCQFIFTQQPLEFTGLNDCIG